MNGIRQVIPRKIKEGRILRGLTASKFADLIGVTRQAVSKYETGKSNPKPEIMLNIIEVLKLPLSFFYDKTDNYSYEVTTYFRKYKSTNKMTRDMIKQQNKLVYKIFRMVEGYVNFPMLNLPNELNKYVKEGNYSLNEIELIASILRTNWNLGNEPIKNLTYTMEKNGFIITRKLFNSLEVDACSEMINGTPFIFLSSDKNNCVRSRFNLAHELGHMILHMHMFEDDFENSKTYDQMESEAHAFAGAFLLPRDSFGQEIMSTNLDHLTLLKKRWRVSIQCMTTRAYQMDYFSENQYTRVYKMLGRMRMRKNEPLDKSLLPEKPVMFKQSIELLIKNNILTQQQLKDIIRINGEEIEDILSLEKGTLANDNTIVKLTSIKKEA